MLDLREVFALSFCSGVTFAVISAPYWLFREGIDGVMIVGNTTTILFFIGASVVVARRAHAKWCARRDVVHFYNRD